MLVAEVNNQALSANAYRQASWHMSFHNQDGFPEMLVDDDVRDYLTLFYGYVAYGGASFGGPGAKAPFTAQQIDEYARTYQRPQVLTGGFELYRTLAGTNGTTRPRSRSPCRRCC